MRSRRIWPGFSRGLLRVLLGLTAFLPLASALLFAENSPLPKMSTKTREEIVHAFNAELVYIRTNFPMGKTGLKLKNGVTTPNGTELQQLMAMWGPAVKPGDRARISDVFIKSDHIRFEINGGPIKKKKWYQRVEVGGAAGTVPIAPGDASTNARGSYVDLYFDKYVPELTGPEVKKLLYAVFDFNSKSALEAYLESVPPKVKEAIQQHRLLVGMNQDMVIYAKGRPPRRVREKDGDVEYEEWVYGAPPQDVDFVRFVGDEVVRIETMSVDGKKMVRVEKEVDLGDSSLARKQGGQERPANAPTLRRPGEEMPDTHSSQPSGLPPLAPPAPGPPGSDPVPKSSDPGPNYATS